MNLEKIAGDIKQRLAMAPPLNAKVKFDFGAEGLIHVDGTQTPPVVSHEDSDADTTLICALSTFETILNGTQDPNVAFMTGKLKIKGSVGLALKLGAILED